MSLQDEQVALHDRSLRARLPADFSTLLLLSQGTLLIGEGAVPQTGPALAFWPGRRRPELTLQAGSSARLLGLSDEIVLDAIGTRSESVHLRMLVENPFVVPLSVGPDQARIETLFAWFAHELALEDRRSQMSLSAFLRIVLIAALRLHSPDVQSARPETTSVLRRFRHFVELHYRDHWPVSRYVDELNVEYERLHRICKRDTGRSPVELIHERLTAEAKARLENTGDPLKKIAEDLGFADASRFSHFFKRRANMSPGAYRTAISRSGSEGLQELRRAFADWP